MKTTKKPSRAGRGAAPRGSPPFTALSADTVQWWVFKRGVEMPMAMSWSEDACREIVDALNAKANAHADGLRASSNTVRRDVGPGKGDK